MPATSEEASPLDSYSPPREATHPQLLQQQQPRDGDVDIASGVDATESKREEAMGGGFGPARVEFGDGRLVAAAVAPQEGQPRQTDELSLLLAPPVAPREGQPRQTDELSLLAPPAVAAPPPPPPPPLPPTPQRRPRRVAGGEDPVAACPSLSRLLALVASDSRAFQHSGAVLRVKQYLRADAGPRELDAVIDALRRNSRVQALYLQNFELGMGDAQLRRLAEMLKVNRNIWALNVGENFGVSLAAWREFAAALPQTSVSFLYVSEHHLARSAPPLKPLLRAAVRANRDRLLLEGRVPSAGLARLVKNMWWNPTAWLERLGVGTRTTPGRRGGGGGEAAVGGGSGGGKKKKPFSATLVRREDRGAYEPSRRPTSRSGAALRAAESRLERWEELRRAAREAAARRSAAQAERLRVEAETVAAVRGLVARALEAAGVVVAGGGGGGGGGGASRVALASSSSSSFSPAALSSSSPLTLASKGSTAAKHFSSAKKRKSEEEAAREDEKRRREKEELAAEEGPPPSPRLQRNGGNSSIPPPLSRHRKPSELLPRLGKAVPCGAAVPRRPRHRWRLLDGERGRSRTPRSAEGVLRALEALLGGEEERRRRGRLEEAAGAPRKAPKKVSKEEAKIPKEKKEKPPKPPPTELALKRRAAKAERAAAAKEKGGGGGGGEEGGEEALPSPLPPLPLPAAEEEQEQATAVEHLTTPPPPPPLRQRLAAALLSDAAATAAATATEAEAETAASGSEKEAAALQPPLSLPPPAAEQQQQQHQQQQQQQDKPTFDFDVPLFENVPESEWAM